MTNNNQGMFIFIMSLITLSVAGALLLAYGLVTSIERDHGLAQRQLAPFWQEANTPGIDRQITAWLSTQDHQLSHLGTAWLAQEVQQDQHWSYTDPVPLGPDTRMITATARVTVPIPQEGDTLTATIPWYLRLDQDARGIIARPKGSMLRTNQTRGITASPQWHLATLAPEHTDTATTPTPTPAGPQPLLPGASR